MTETNNVEANENKSSSSCKNDHDHKKCCPISRFSRVIIYALLGSLLTVFVQNYHYKQQMLMHYSNPDFNHRDVFAEMQVIERRLDNMMEINRQYMASQDRRQKASSHTAESNVISKQDNDYYYYELSFSGFKKDDISVKIKDNILTFSAKSKGDGNAISNFYYSFSIPQYDLKKEPQIIRNDDKIVVKFEKKK